MILTPALGERVHVRPFEPLIVTLNVQARCVGGA